MGINFIAASPWSLFEDESEKYIQALRTEVSESVPLGRDVPEFIMPDEMGWSWWSALQTLAEERLGKEGCAQICAVDAWAGVYVDAALDRKLIWLNGKPDKPKQVRVSVHQRPLPWYRRPLKWIGLAPKPELPPEIERMMTEMVQQCGARQGEQGAFQVGNIRQLHTELTNLVSLLGHEATQESIEQLHRSYLEDDDRVDDDPEIQCLCHAWLTSRYAIEQGVPMWLLK